MCKQNSDVVAAQARADFICFRYCWLVYSGTFNHIIYSHYMFHMQSFDLPITTNYSFQTKVLRELSSMNNIPLLNVVE